MICSFTFDSVQSQTDLVWRYERYLLVRDYFERPPLFPPFIIFTHFYELFKLCLRHLPGRKPSHMSVRRAKSFSKELIVGIGVDCGLCSL